MADLTIALRISEQGARQAASAVGSVGSALGGVAKIAGGFVLGQGLLALPDLLSGAAEAARDDEAATKRLQTSLKNLGGDVALHTKQVDAAIASGQKLAFTDDQVRDSYQFLATATGSSEEALKRQKIAMDLSRGAGISMEMASKLVGKVTEENVQQFKKLGITVRDGATEQEALAAIQAKFAGQADAYASSSKGQAEAASIAFGEMQESLGGAILPLISKLGGLVVENLPSFEAMAETLGTALAGGVDLVIQGIDALGPVLAPVVDAFGTFGRYIGAVLEDGDYLNDWLSDLPGPLKLVAEDIGIVVSTLQKLASGDIAGAVENLSKGFSDLGPKVLKEVQAGLDALGAWIVDTGVPFLAGKLGEWIPAFYQWIGDAVPKALAALSGFLVQFLDGIGRGGEEMGESTASKWVAAVVDWIANDALPALAEALPKIGAALVDFVVTVGPALAGAIGRLAANFWEWIQTDAVPTLERELPKIAEQLGLWLANDAIPWAAENLPRLGLELIQGVVAGLTTAWNDHLSPWLSGLISGEGSARGDTANILGLILKYNPASLLAKVGVMVLQGLLDGLLSKWGGTEGVSAWVTDIPNKITGAVGDLGTLLTAAGSKALQSLIDGLNAQLQPLRDAVSGIVNAIPTWVQDLLGITSPSKVMFELGSNITEGLRLGMLSKLGGVEGAVQSLIDKALETLGSSSLSGSVTDWLSAALSITNTPMDWLPGLLKLVQAESTGNPRAWNPVPVSTGEHATGLLQTIPSTFASNALPGMGDIYNPVHNAVAAIRYIKGRYGSVYNTPLFTSGGEYLGYEKGGVIREPVVGLGLRSGKGYALGEAGPEVVTPLGRYTQGSNGGWLQGGRPVVQEMVTPLGRYRQINGKWVRMLRAEDGSWVPETFYAGGPVARITTGGGPPVARVAPSFSLSGGPPNAPTVPADIYKQPEVAKVVEEVKSLWGQDMTDRQFGGDWSAGWDEAAIYAACGAIAAEGFADYFGHPEYTTGGILADAQERGIWSRERGWAGPQSWAEYVSGLIGRRVGSTSLGDAVGQLESERPIAISSASLYHYLLGQGWDGSRMFVGNTGANALKSGSAWMTPGQFGASTYLRAYANGGWINEPVVGMGLRSGQGYSFAEHRPEYVSPGGADVTVHVHIEGPVYGVDDLDSRIKSAVERGTRDGSLRLGQR